MKLFLSLCFALGLAATHARTADACQLTRTYSPLEFLADDGAVLLIGVIGNVPGGHAARVQDVISGSHDGRDVVLPGSDCGYLEVGAQGYLGISRDADGKLADIATTPYRFAPLPTEVANIEFYEAFARAGTAKQRAKVIAKHVAQGWAAYVDFPDIAVYLHHAPEVVNAMSRREAAQTLRNLRRHPRARIPDRLRQRAR